MKSLKLNYILGICAAIFYISACSKKNTPTPAKSNSIAGYWFGSADGGSFNQSFLLRANGTVKVYDFYYNPTSTDTTKAYDGVGTYTVAGSIITVNTSFPDGETFSATAQLNSTSNPTIMTFGTAASGYNGDVYKKQ